MLEVEGEAEWWYILFMLRSISIHKLSNTFKIIKLIQAVTQIIPSWILFIPKKWKDSPGWLLWEIGETTYLSLLIFFKGSWMVVVTVSSGMLIIQSLILWKKAPYPGETVPPTLIKIVSNFPVWMDNQKLTDIWGKWKGKIMTGKWIC